MKPEMKNPVFQVRKSYIPDMIRSSTSWWPGINGIGIHLLMCFLMTSGDSIRPEKNGFPQGISH